MIFQCRHVVKSVLPFAAILLAVTALAEDRTEKQDRERLQGTWTLTAREVEGKVEKIAPDQKRHHRLVIDGQRAGRKYWDVSRSDRLSDDYYFGQESRDDRRVTYFPAEFTFKLEPERNPENIIFFSPFNYGPEGVWGVAYVLEGDSLKLKYPARYNQPASAATYQRVNKPVKVEKTWEGGLMGRDDAALIKDAPLTGCVTTAEQWATLWKAWRRTDKLPQLNFERTLVLIHTEPGSVEVEFVPELDSQGDLTLLCSIGRGPPPTGDESSGPPPGFAYRLTAIPREGIKSIGGKPLK